MFIVNQLLSLKFFSGQCGLFQF